METNLKVSLSAITTSLHNYSKRLGTKTEKHQFYEIVDGLGAAIAKQYEPLQGQGSTGQGSNSPGGSRTNFNAGEWMTECGVSADWATIAA